MTHTVSIFFLGIILYHKVKFIKKCVDRYLISLEIKIIEKDPNHEFVKVPFKYYWFLVCFYHDLGYFSLKNEGVNLFNHDTWEGREFEVRTILEKIKGLGHGIPDFIMNNSFKYLDYRKEQFINDESDEPIDHGFLSGTYYYYNREKKFKEIFSSIENRYKDRCVENELHWSKYLLEVVHPSISWNIISHNVWFKKEIEGTGYRDKGMNDLISNHPKVVISEYPLYFLLSLVDTIDFVKSFINLNDFDIDWVTNTRTVLENVSFEKTTTSNSFRIQLEGYDRDQFYLKMKKNEYWLGFRVEKFEHNGITFTISV